MTPSAGSEPLFTQYEDRAAYETRQITASTGKFSYCKFGDADAANYVSIVRRDEGLSPAPWQCVGIRRIHHSFLRSGRRPRA